MSEPCLVGVKRIPASVGDAIEWFRLLLPDGGTSGSSAARPIDFVDATGRIDLNAGTGSALTATGGVEGFDFAVFAIFCLL